MENAITPMDMATTTKVCLAHRISAASVRVTHSLLVIFLSTVEVTVRGKVGLHHHLVLFYSHLGFNALHSYKPLWPTNTALRCVYMSTDRPSHWHGHEPDRLEEKH